eukprot:2287933-Karenia_brevis.AAC.1
MHSAFMPCFTANAYPLAPMHWLRAFRAPNLFKGLQDIEGRRCGSFIATCARKNRAGAMSWLPSN